jgi:hypothetical protein
MASSSSAIPPLKGVTRYPPAGESANELWMERSNLDGAVLTGVAYGMRLYASHKLSPELIDIL